ncbi:MAG: hypothetical protein IT453_06425 [Planctomycetes bacterium]|nr:hypothetical protein [Planctomycetota bacterium]
MRALLVLVLLIGGAAFFLSSTEEGSDRKGPTVSAWDGGRRSSEERVESPSLATEIEADAEGHVTIFLGDNGGEDAGAAAQLHVAGRVIDPRGDAVEGLALAYRSSAELGSEPDTAQVRCDSLGSFTLTADSTYAEFSCEDTRWTLLFAGIEESGAHGFRLTLIAAPTTPCAGLVLDRAGHRIEGARVQVTGRVEIPRMRNLTAHDFARRVDSDERGHFDLGRVPLLAPTSLRAHTPELGSAELELVSSEDRDLSIVLQGVQ